VVPCRWSRLNPEYAKRRGVDTLVGKESTMKPDKKGTRKFPKSTTGIRKGPTGFTDEERVAMIWKATGPIARKCGTAWCRTCGKHPAN